MKIKGETYAIMRDAMKRIVDHYGVVGNLCLSDLWRIWNLAADDLQNSDDHPIFKVRKRIVPQNSGFDPYSNGINDNHIETALKKIAGELGIRK